MCVFLIHFISTFRCSLHVVHTSRHSQTPLNIASHSCHCLQCSCWRLQAAPPVSEACLLSLQWLVCMRCRLIFPWLFDQDVSDQFWFSNYNYFSLLLQASDRAIAHFAAVFFLCRIHSWTIGKTDTFMPGKTYIIRYYLQKLSLMWNNHCKCTENYLQALLIDKNDQSCTVDVWLLQF